MKIIATNRKATFNYFIEEKLEAGIILTGSEVKSLRNGKANIEESYVSDIDGELHLINSSIAKYSQSNRFNHEEKRPRKLLLHVKQINKFLGAIKKKGNTIIPLRLYFNPKNRVKVEIALASGKKLFDKRATIKERDWQREKARLLKNGK
jgi:SsrA-binding protein